MVWAMVCCTRSSHKSSWGLGHYHHSHHPVERSRRQKSTWTWIDLLDWLTGPPPKGTTCRNPGKLTSWYGKSPIIYNFLYISGACLGFLLSTVAWQWKIPAMKMYLLFFNMVIFPQKSHVRFPGRVYFVFLSTGKHLKSFFSDVHFIR